MASEVLRRGRAVVSGAAVVTGAAAGIGRALAVALAGRGCPSVLWDVDAAGLAGTARECRAAGVEVRTDVVDVGDRTAVHRAAVAARAVDDGAGARSAADGGRADGGPGGGPGPVRLVFAVAGVIHTGSVSDSLPRDVDRLLAVNLHGTIHTVEAFLPQVLAAGGGHLVTTSSVFGLVTVPRYSAYCASKAAVLAYTDALRMELAAEDAPVTVSCVVPGGVRTGIVRAGSFAPAEDRDAVAARFETRIARTSPQQAAEVILAGVARRRRRILVGPDAHAAATLARITGTGYKDPSSRHCGTGHDGPDRDRPALTRASTLPRKVGRNHVPVRTGSAGPLPVRHPPCTDAAPEPGHPSGDHHRPLPPRGDLRPAVTHAAIPPPVIERPCDDVQSRTAALPAAVPPLAKPTGEP